MMKEFKFKAVLSHFESSPLWGRYFDIPEEIAIQLVEGNDRRVICVINDVLKLHSALMPNKGNWFIMLNKENQKKLDVSLNTTIFVCLIKDRSEYGMPMPDEFREVLNQEPDADKYFHELTPGKQRTLLHIVSKVKSVDSRIRKSLAICDHLLANKGFVDYKLLNEAIKEYNKM
jgi:hypothetical protein